MSASWEIREGDALERLADMPDESVQCCVTSPPYFGLRDYASKPPAWPPVEYALPGGTVAVAAMKCALGLEPTPEAFVGHLVLVFREVRRALRSDGTLWLNIGDSYAASRSGTVGDLCGLGSREHRERVAAARNQERSNSRESWPQSGIKTKDLLGIPWLLAFALRADGWYLRSDVIWGKPNPMPESVTDRPTSAHEHVFLLSKSPRYFYDANAIREPDSGQDHARTVLDGQPSLSASNGSPHRGIRTPEGRDGLGRNKRNVWEIATHPFPGSHFATFPPKLIEPCILAGSAVGDVILDPFAGAGTTGLVALRHDRSFIGIELNPAYAEMARERIRQDAPLLNTPAEAVA